MVSEHIGNCGAHEFLKNENEEEDAGYVVVVEQKHFVVGDALLIHSSTKVGQRREPAFT